MTDIEKQALTIEIIKRITAADGVQFILREVPPNAVYEEMLDFVENIRDTLKERFNIWLVFNNKERTVLIRSFKKGNQER